MEELIEIAERENWCRSQGRVWEPCKTPHFEKKQLAKLSPKGPQSCLTDLRDETRDNMLRVGGMARLVEKLEQPAVDLIIQRGKHYTDELSIVL